MKTTKLLAGAVVVAIGGLAMTSIASATTTVTPLEGETVNYILNGNEPFSAGVLQIDDGEIKIFILDRNLGAKAAGIGCEDPNWSDACPASDSTYGYHFQWGNNYGFNPNSMPSTSSTKVQASSLIYNPLQQQYFRDSTFITENENRVYSDAKVDLWGGSTADYISSLNGNNWQVTNATDRQGPCPEGFHVPSFGELLKVKDMMGNDASVIHNDLLVPFAGIRHYNDAEVYYLGGYVSLWSSSPSEMDSSSFRLPLDIDGTIFLYDDVRANATSVRCFHDFYQTYTKASNLPSEGGDGSGQVTLTLTEGQNTCTLQDYNLGTHNVSVVDQVVQSESQEIVCEFLQNSGFIVTMSMSDLSAGETTAQKIGANNFTGKILSGDYAGSIVDLAPGNYNLSGSHTIYTKEANKIGIWTGSLQIEGIIPAGTPSGTYTGLLDIVIQAGV